MAAIRGPRTRAVKIAAAMSASLLLGGACGVTVAEATVTPLSPANYTSRPVCAPPAPEHAGCLAFALVPLSAPARAHLRPLAISSARAIPAASAAAGAFGLRPADLHSAYNLPTEAPVQQTIAVVDAFDDPNIEGDLAVYDREFGLPPCTAANGCLTKINAAGAGSPLPPASGEWSFEIALDVEISHAICENCRILLVEASSSSDQALAEAEQRAYLAGATEITNSYGGPEPALENEAYNHPGVVIAAAAGDEGYLGWAAQQASERGYVDYPAASPHVIAVGATHLTLGEDGQWRSEAVWNNDQGASASGCAANFAAPQWQLALPNWSAIGCGSRRAVADISAVGDPYTGAAIYDSMPWGGYTMGWVTAGGTSLAAPIIAGAYALAGGAHGHIYPAQTLYENAQRDPGAFHDVSSGANGECRLPSSSEGLSGCSDAEAGAACALSPICVSGPGYDGPSGVGSPAGLAAFAATGAKALGMAEEPIGGEGAGVAHAPGAKQPTKAAPPAHSIDRHGRKRSTTVLRNLHLSPPTRRALHRHRALRTLAFSFQISAAGAIEARLLRIAGAQAARSSGPGSGAGGRTKIVARLRHAVHRGVNLLALHPSRLKPGNYRLVLILPDHLLRRISFTVS